MTKTTDLIERLRKADLENFSGVMAQAADLIERLTSENMRLREVLEPFADLAAFYDDCEQHPGGCPDDATAGEVPDLTVGDFRAARKALAENR